MSFRYVFPSLPLPKDCWLLPLPLCLKQQAGHRCHPQWLSFSPVKLKGATILSALRIKDRKWTVLVDPLVHAFPEPIQLGVCLLVCFISNTEPAISKIAKDCGTRACTHTRLAGAGGMGQLIRRLLYRDEFRSPETVQKLYGRDRHLQSQPTGDRKRKSPELAGWRHESKWQAVCSEEPSAQYLK